MAVLTANTFELLNRRFLIFREIDARKKENDN